MVTGSERSHWNALKIGTSGEVNSKEGRAVGERLLDAPTKGNEAGTHQIELDGAVGEILVYQPPSQCLRTRLIFDVRIDNPFLDRLIH